MIPCSIPFQTLLLSLISLSLSLPAAPGWSIWTGGMWSIPDDDGEMTVMMAMMVIMITLQVTTSPELEAVTIRPRVRLTSAPLTQQTRDVEEQNYIPYDWLKFGQRILCLIN